MKDWISKLRAKQTRQREKRTGLMAATAAPLNENPMLALLVIICLLFSSLFLIRIEDILGDRLDSGRILDILGDGILLAAGLLASGLAFRIQRPQLIRKNSNLFLLALISLLSLAAGEGMLHLARTGIWLDQGVARFLLPFALAPLLTTVLLDGFAGIVVGAWTSLTLTLAAGAYLPLLLAGILASTVAALFGERVRKRVQIFKAGAAAGMAELVCVVAVTLLDHDSFTARMALNQAGACLGGAFLSAIVVLLILPVFEVAFHITTDIRLLELSDLGHELLQRLAIEAPGTYHHSLVVANLAQAATDDIGANSLLARVSAYYHDIGKLTKPEFFSENIMHRENPHDDLPPSMSTLVIIAHVKEGLSLALLHKLPLPILRVISEHHGTSLVSFFHHKAKAQREEELSQQERNQTNGHNQVNEADFRYPGPRPSTRESAIVSLADAVEATSRSMEKIKPGQIEGMVNDIVQAKIQDNQLDDCNLSMAEVATVKRSLVFTLTNMLHGRIPYPKDEDRDKQQSKPPSSRPAEAPKAD